MSKKIKKEDEQQENKEKNEKRARQERLNSLYGAHGEINWRDELLLQYIENDIKCMLEVNKNKDKGAYCKSRANRHALFRPKMAYPFETNIGRIHARELDKHAFEVIMNGHRVLNVFSRINQGKLLGQIRWAENVKSFNFFISSEVGLSVPTLKDIAYLCECLTKKEKKHPTKLLTFKNLYESMIDI